MIVFIVRPFLRPPVFLGIRRIAYEFYYPVRRSFVNQSENAFYASPGRWLRISPRRVPLPVAALLIVQYGLRCRFAQLQVGAHFLDLRGLLFHRCCETRNRAFQFRDSLLFFTQFIEHGLALAT